MIKIPSNLKGKELYKFLVANKSALITQKKSAMKRTDNLIAPVTILDRSHDDGGNKARPSTSTEPLPVGFREIDVKVVANTAWYCDLAMDVLTDKSYDNSVKARGSLLPHIKDHKWESTAHVGDVKSVYTQLVRLSELGYKGVHGNTQTTSLIFETTIKEEYDAKVYLFYKNRKINQHSIGLLYISIGLCINDPDYLPEFELWNKYYSKIINKDVVDEAGYFWIVPEIKILENSCVLFACNELTDTLESEEKNIPEEEITKQQPESTTVVETGNISWKGLDVPRIKPFSITN